MPDPAPPAPNGRSPTALDKIVEALAFARAIVTSGRDVFSRRGSRDIERAGAELSAGDDGSPLDPSGGPP